MDAMQFVASFSGCIRDFGQTEQVVEILVDDIKGMTAEMPEFTTRRGDQPNKLWLVKWIVVVLTLVGV